MSLYVGTSGWAYKEWKPHFYPRDLPHAQFLRYYASKLTACEINATFYRLQADATITKWAAATPESFRFAVKAHRRLTHSAGIAPDPEQRAFLDTFVRSVSQLGPRLGPILLQFPPRRARDDEALRALLRSLPPGARYAFEFRHDSWDGTDVWDAIAQAGATVCVSDVLGRVPERLPPGPFAYVRLRHDRYAPEVRADWLRLLQREASGRDVFVFAKHEGVAAGDEHAGVGLAQWLVQVQD